MCLIFKEILLLAVITGYTVEFQTEYLEVQSIPAQFVNI